MKLSVVVENFSPIHRNSLRGFVQIKIPELHLKIRDISIHEVNDKRWIGLPGKPTLDRDGVAQRDDRNKIAYVPILQFTDRATNDAFAAKVIAELLIFAPAAFALSEVA